MSEKYKALKKLRFNDQGKTGQFVYNLKEIEQQVNTLLEKVEKGDFKSESEFRYAVNQLAHRPKFVGNFLQMKSWRQLAEKDENIKSLILRLEETFGSIRQSVFDSAPNRLKILGGGIRAFVAMNESDDGNSKVTKMNGDHGKGAIGKIADTTKKIKRFSGVGSILGGVGAARIVGNDTMSVNDGLDYSRCEVESTGCDSLPQ